MKKLKIGNVILKSNFALPAIAGFSDVMMRVLCYEFGAGLCCTEMVSAKGLAYGGNKTEDLLITDEREPLKAVQLFGSEPYFMEKAILDERINKFDIIDINMGCPVHKVVKNGDGSALMKDPDKAYEIMKVACSVAGGRPVTVKMRAGYSKDNITALRICELAEKAGVSAVTIHARVRDQFYSGPVDLELIKEIKNSVGITVIGNGEVKSAKDAAKMFELTGCDGIAVARAAIGKPYIFAMLNETDFETDVFDLIERHIKGMLNVLPEEVVGSNMKKQFLAYLKGIPGAKEYKHKITLSKGTEDLLKVLEETRSALR